MTDGQAERVLWQPSSGELCSLEQSFHWPISNCKLSDFSPEEVKRLIRALFQNSDRRAAVLARIKFE